MYHRMQGEGASYSNFDKRLQAGRSHIVLSGEQALSVFIREFVSSSSHDILSPCDRCVEDLRQLNRRAHEVLPLATPTLSAVFLLFHIS